MLISRFLKLARLAGKPAISILLSFALLACETSETSADATPGTASAGAGIISKSEALAEIRAAGYLGDNEQVISAEHVPDKGIWVFYATVEGDPNVRYQVNDEGGDIVRTTP